MELLDDDRRELIRVSIAVAALLIIAVLIVWLASDVGKKALLVQERKRALAERVQALTNAVTLRLDFEKARGAITQLENMLPTRDGLIQLPKEFGEFAVRQGVVLNTTFGAEDASKNNIPGSVEINLNIEGTYDALTGFIKTMEEWRYIVTWRRIDVTERSGKYQAKLSGSVYFR